MNLGLIWAWPDPKGPARVKLTRVRSRSRDRSATSARERALVWSRAKLARPDAHERASGVAPAPGWAQRFATYVADRGCGSRVSPATRIQVSLARVTFSLSLAQSRRSPPAVVAGDLAGDPGVYPRVFDHPQHAGDVKNCVWSFV